MDTAPLAARVAMHPDRISRIELGKARPIPRSTARCRPIAAG